MWVKGKLASIRKKNVNRTCVCDDNEIKESSVIMKPRLAILTTMVFSAAVFRLLPHPPNLTPIAAMALFGAASSAACE